MGPGDYRAAYGSMPLALVQAAQVIGRARRARECEEARVSAQEFERRMKRGRGED